MQADLVFIITDSLNGIREAERGEKLFAGIVSIFADKIRGTKT